MSEETHATAAKMSDAIRKLDNEQVPLFDLLFPYNHILFSQEFWRLSNYSDELNGSKNFTSLSIRVCELKSIRRSW
jgi:hypothetical protein